MASVKFKDYSYSDSRVLRRIFGLKRDEVTGGWGGRWRKLHSEELSYLYCSPNIVRVIKSRRIRRTGNVTCIGERRGVYRVFVGKREGKRPLGRPRHRWRIILRWICMKWDVGAWTGSIWLKIGTRGRHL